MAQPFNPSPDLAGVLNRIPGWSDGVDSDLEKLEGLTNTNFRVTVNGEKYILRVSGQNAARLGIDRALELEALQAAFSVGLAPEVVHILLPEGHLVTRCIEGRHWTQDEYRLPENLRRLLDAVKRLHALPQVRATFSPFQRVESFASQARCMQVPFPSDFARLEKKMAAIQRDQERDPCSWLRFCHNDLFSVNVMDDGQVRFIDWEFAGMGDRYYDLATLFYAYDSADTLPRASQEYVMACYFGEVHPQNWSRLEGMQFMLMFFSAMWGLLQYGLQRQGLVRVVEGFDFLEYAETTFEGMR